ncbi:MAG: sigma-70 family RNA polymerase sigma factor [Candidatus Acidiferrum sp.]
MQDALPALVLHSEALPPAAMPISMNDAPSTPAFPASPASDEYLMLAFSKGSAESFNELFLRYKQPIYGFFRRRTIDPHRAEELSQETFLVLLRAATRYEPRALFRTYLYAIAFKILRAHRRKAAFRATFFGQPKSAPDPARQDATESALWVRRAVEKLDSLDREILLLREFEQLSYAEIADLLGVPLNTVRSRLFRARTALRDLLDPSAATSPNEAKPSAEEAAPPAATQTIPQKGVRL